MLLTHCSLLLRPGGRFGVHFQARRKLKAYVGDDIVGLQVVELPPYVLRSLENICILDALVCLFSVKHDVQP